MILFDQSPHQFNQLFCFCHSVFSSSSFLREYISNSKLRMMSFILSLSILTELTSIIIHKKRESVKTPSKYHNFYLPGLNLTPSALLRAASDCLATASFLVAFAASDFLYAPANKDLPILSNGFEEVCARLLVSDLL